MDLRFAAKIKIVFSFFHVYVSDSEGLYSAGIQWLQSVGFFSELFGADFLELCLLQRCWRDLESIKSKFRDERAWYFEIKNCVTFICTGKI